MASRNSQRNRLKKLKKLQKQLGHKAPAAVTLAHDKPKDKSPPASEPQQKTKNWEFWERHIDKIVWAVFGIVAVGILVNRVSVDPESLYIVAFLLFVVIAWTMRRMGRLLWLLIPILIIIGFPTHKYVTHVEMRSTKSPQSPTNAAPLTLLSGPEQPRGLEFREEIGYVTLSIGGMEVGLSTNNLSRDPAKRKQHIIVFNDGFEPINPYIENGRLFCDVELFGGDGYPKIKLKHNVLSGRPPGWDWQQNERAIEIVNANLAPIFQMYWKSESHVVFNGIFPAPGGLWICTENRFESVGFGTLERLYPSGQIPLDVKRIFKYPSYRYPKQTE